MSTIDPLSIAPAAQSNDDKTKSSGDVFGKDAFMKLLVEQLRHQSPDNSSDPNAFINQMTQFSVLEQLQNQSTVQQQQNAASLIGHTVKYLDPKGASVEGLVEAVDYGSNGAATLTVGGQTNIDPGKVFQVR
jgi:flagellar basal-body rod modification protein FlgD